MFGLTQTTLHPPPWSFCCPSSGRWRSSHLLQLPPHHFAWQIWRQGPTPAVTSQYAYISPHPTSNGRYVSLFLDTSQPSSSETKGVLLVSTGTPIIASSKDTACTSNSSPVCCANRSWENIAGHEEPHDIMMHCEGSCPVGKGHPPYLIK